MICKGWEAFLYGNLNPLSIQPVHRHQLGRVAVLDEDVRQAELQDRLQDACVFKGLHHAHSELHWTAWKFPLRFRLLPARIAATIKAITGKRPGRTLTKDARPQRAASQHESMNET